MRAHLPALLHRTPPRRSPNRVMLLVVASVALSLLATAVATLVARRGMATDAGDRDGSAADPGYAPTPLTADVDAVTAADLRPVSSVP